jgi:hypothetical protein
MRVDLPDIIYTGNRGLEISGRQLEFVEPVAATRSVQLREITDSLASRLQGIPGVLVEFKGLTSTVHYRGAADTVIPVVENAVHAAVAPFASLFQEDREGRPSISFLASVGIKVARFPGLTSASACGTPYAFTLETTGPMKMPSARCPAR